MTKTRGWRDKRMQFLFYLYLRFADLSATYGPVRSTIGLLLWLYYSSFLIILGAEFSAVRKLEMED